MRESYSIKAHWSYGGYGYKRYILYHKIKSVIYLLFNTIRTKESRFYFIYDNITIPFNIKFKCGLLKKHIFVHQYNYSIDDSYYYCKNCGKTLSENDYIIYLRYKKIKKLRKKCN